ncbi:hypothetical protein CLOM_g24049 [Closterium sp. NIES-68]|nr:hypothetical protein CLOM_g24049 [Closterium sp. NIES-68]
MSASLGTVSSSSSSSARSGGSDGCPRLVNIAGLGKRGGRHAQREALIHRELEDGGDAAVHSSWEAAIAPRAGMTAEARENGEAAALASLPSSIQPLHRSTSSPVSAHVDPSGYVSATSSFQQSSLLASAAVSASPAASHGSSCRVWMPETSVSDVTDPSAAAASISIHSSWEIEPLTHASSTTSTSSNSTHVLDNTHSHATITAHAHAADTSNTTRSHAHAWSWVRRAWALPADAVRWYQQSVADWMVPGLGLPVTADIIAIALVYFVQGVLGLARLAVSFFLKDEFGLDPAETALLSGLSTLPWLIKPLYGFLSDGFPLFGSRRRSYLILCGFLGASAWALLASLVRDKYSTVAMILLSSLSVAMSDVVVDSMVVERARGEGQEMAGSLQSLCWGANSVGGIVSAYWSGSLVEMYGTRFVFAVTAILPLIISIAGIFTIEDNHPHSRSHDQSHQLSSLASPPHSSSSSVRSSHLSPISSPPETAPLIPLSAHGLSASPALSSSSSPHPPPSSSQGAFSIELGHMSQSERVGRGRVGMGGILEGRADREVGAGGDGRGVVVDGSGVRDMGGSVVGGVGVGENEQQMPLLRPYASALSDSDATLPSTHYAQQPYHHEQQQHWQQQRQQQPANATPVISESSISSPSLSSSSPYHPDSATFPSSPPTNPSPQQQQQHHPNHHSLSAHPLSSNTNTHNPSSSSASSSSSSTSSSSLPASHTSSSSPIPAMDVRAQVLYLWATIRQPSILMPTLFIFLWQITPSSDTAMFFFTTNQLGFGPEFLGRVRLVTAVASLVGVGVYNLYLKQVPLQRIFLWSNLLGTALGCTQLLLVTGVNRTLGISDHYFALGDSLILTVLGQISFMPVLVLAARLCPPGIEATLFATLMSVNNGAYVVSGLIGALLTEMLGVTSTNFHNLALLVLLCNLSSLLALPFLRLLPSLEEVEEAVARLQGDIEAGKEA